jgi:hypothetical protein
MVGRVLIVSVLMLGWLIGSSAARAQAGADHAILFRWDDQLQAQSIDTGELVSAGRLPLALQAPPIRPYLSVNTFSESPLTEPPLDGYGFEQGVWSPDRAAFAYLAIQPNDAGYRVMLWAEGQQRVLFSGVVGPERGYLVPVGWAADAHLILLERHGLRNLESIRLWGYLPGQPGPTFRASLPVPALKGNSATLDDSWVFVGFDTVGMLGYRVNLNSQQRLSFPIRFAIPNPFGSVFETFPLEVLGVVEMSAFTAWLEQTPAPATLTPPIEQVPLLEPFLYWPLPDAFRSITCYPDSE